MDDGAVRRRLEEERGRATERLEAAHRELDDLDATTHNANIDDEHDPEGSTVAFERARVDALGRESARRLADVDRALARLASGDYGRCERCGRPIGAERLRALPTADRCIACAGR